MGATSQGTTMTEDNQLKMNSKKVQPFDQKLIQQLLDQRELNAEHVRHAMANKR